MARKISDIEKQDRIKELKKVVRRGNTVYVVLRSASKSGASRTLSLFVIKYNKYTKRAEPYWITQSIADICDYRLDKEGAIRVNGGGMDMGFDVVYHLSLALFGYENRGGYALSHQWI